MHCNKCKLIYRNKRAADSWGNTSGKILILRDNPTTAECSSGNIKYSKANKILIKTLDEFNFDNNYFVTNVINCYPHTNFGRAELDACLPYFKDTFILGDFKFVITAGLLAYKIMTGNYNVNRISDVAGTMTKLDDVFVYHTYSFLHMAKDISLVPLFYKSMHLLVGDYKYLIDINHKTKL